MLSYWVRTGRRDHAAQLPRPGGTANSAGSSYPPLSVIANRGARFWLVGMIFLITSSLLGSVNFIVTIVQLRAKGMDHALPFFVHAQLVTSSLLLLAFLPPRGRGRPAAHGPRRRHELLHAERTDRQRRASHERGRWQPAAVAAPLLVPGPSRGLRPHSPRAGHRGRDHRNNTRKPLWGYKSMVYAAIFLGFMSFVVWAHHMFLTGMGITINAFFQTTTMIISIPSVIILSALFLSLYGGSIRFNTPMLFALAFLPMFGIGGLTGLPLGLAAADLHLHDTYYVIGHFHYVVAPGTIFAMFAGIYYWFPKISGRGRTRPSARFTGARSSASPGIFFPMSYRLAGVSRRCTTADSIRTRQSHRSADEPSRCPRRPLRCFRQFHYTFWHCSAIAAVRRIRTFGKPLRSTAATTSPPSATAISKSCLWSTAAVEYSVPGATAEFIPSI